MRIINQPIPGITKAYNQQNKENGVVRTVVGSSQKDRINISAEARFFNTARTALQQLPEFNERKLEELKQMVKTGTYEVQKEELAEKIWQESFLDQRI